MRIKIVTTLVASTFLLAASAVTLMGADKQGVTDEFRQKFISEFRRTGLNTTAGDAMFLRVTVAARNAQRGVEVGAASGYGAINMGIAFERNGGQLFTIDIDPKMVRLTRQNVEKMGLQDTVKVIEGDALQELPKLTGEFDFVFIDALKRDYLKYFKAIEPKLKKGAVVIADNVIQSADDMQDFLDHLKNHPDYEVAIIRASMEKNDGMAVCYKIR